MKLKRWIVYFTDDSIGVWAIFKSEAKILGQAERVKQGKDFKVIKICEVTK